MVHRIRKRWLFNLLKMKYFYLFIHRKLYFFAPVSRYLYSQYQICNRTNDKHYNCIMELYIIDTYIHFVYLQGFWVRWRKRRTLRPVPAAVSTPWPPSSVTTSAKRFVLQIKSKWMKNFRFTFKNLSFRVFEGWFLKCFTKEQAKSYIES